MHFSLFRVDDRLIHGQVVEGWARPLSVTTIIVANDRIANDASQKLIFEFAVPPEIKTIFSTIDNMTNELPLIENESSRTIILFSTIDDVYKLVDNGFKLDKLNLGGMRSVENKMKLSQTVFVSTTEIKILNMLLKKGIDINIQSVPGEKQKNLKELFSKKHLLE